MPAPVVPLFAPDLKILIVSTPKTGNTWLKNLLSAVYDLPMVIPSATFDEKELARFGPRWIGHQHFLPLSNLLHWAQQQHVILLTTVRHPGDVLVSLYHYVRTPSGQQFGPGVDLLLADANGPGPNTARYIREYFHYVLHTSIEWLCTGQSQQVRYESLWQNPAQVLQQITQHIVPVPLDAMERAVEQSDIDLLRQQHKTGGEFFRQGKMGKWANVLPPEVVDAFRRPPYPAQFAALGYSLDKPVASDASEPVTYLPKSPFRGLTHFDNGVPIPSVAIRLYLSFDSALTQQRWPSVVDTRAHDSFYAWLMAPSDDDPQRQMDAPLVSNVVMRLYRDRSDLMAAFPDAYGQDRVDWVLWFLKNAHTEFGIPEAFILPIRQSMITWAGQISVDETAPEYDLPPLTNLARYIYYKRPDMQTSVPDLNGLYRVDYIFWFFSYAARDGNFDPELVIPTRQRFVTWANEPDPLDIRRPVGMPLMTRWAAHTYIKRPEYQQAFPDVYGKDRMDFLSVFVQERIWLAEATRAIIESWADIVRNTPA